MALVDNTKFHLNKENMTQTNINIGKDLEEKMQTRMNSNVQPIKSAVSYICVILFRIIFEASTLLKRRKEMFKILS